MLKKISGVVFTHGLIGKTIWIVFILFGFIKSQDCGFSTTLQNSADFDSIEFRLSIPSAGGEPKIIRTVINGTIAPTSGLDTAALDFPGAGSPSPFSIFFNSSECELPVGPSTQTWDFGFGSTRDDWSIDLTNDYGDTVYIFEIIIIHPDPISVDEDWQLQIKNLPVGIQYRVETSFSSYLEGNVLDDGSDGIILTSVTTCPVPINNTVPGKTSRPIIVP
ncbi:MAG: hypothetical protein GY808_07675 [Gammaproteobacteria bacterium]|nr:hypothetical protein [Gammaproteobacteria bacterium]